MSNTIIVWYLVITIRAGIAIVPQPYETKEECEAAATIYKDKYWAGSTVCLPNTDRGIK